MGPCSNLKDPVVLQIRKVALEAAKVTVFEPVMDKGKPIEATLLIKYRLKPKPEPKEEGVPDSGDIDSVVGGVVNGRAISLPKPEYPGSLRGSRVGGTVNVQVIISEDGHVSSAGAVTGHPDLAENSVKAACKARFTSTLLSGQPVKVSGIITYNFVP
jgi:TonB family protein